MRMDAQITDSRGDRSDRGDIALRAELSSLLVKHETVINMNSSLKEAIGRLKEENEEMALDRDNFMKETSHLRMQIHELEQRISHHRQTE